MNRESAATHREGYLVPGEYNVVARASRDVESLMLAHATPLTRDGAKRLAAAVARAFNAPEHRLMFVARNGQFASAPKRRMETRKYADGTYLTHWRTGKPRKRLAVVRDAAGAVVWENRVSLPRQTRAHATPDGPWHGLRVGVVLHEYSHLLDYARRKTTRHDATFTAVLDELVAWWVRTCGGV